MYMFLIKATTKQKQFERDVNLLLSDIFGNYISGLFYIPNLNKILVRLHTKTSNF